LIGAAAVACEKAFGAAPVFVRSGGTNPAVAAFQHTLNIPIALIGFGLPDDNIHAPNERFYLPNLQKGIATSILFMHKTKHWPQASSHSHRPLARCSREFSAENRLNGLRSVSSAYTPG
jgi:hypothetical protein